MSVVIDAPLALTWYFEDEATRATDAVLDQVAASGATVPGLWRIEVANALQMAIRRKRIDAIYRDAALAELARLPITIDEDADAHVWTTTLNLADRYALTLYDATYLDLAWRRSLPLATLDQALRTAATALGLVLLGAAGD